MKKLIALFLAGVLCATAAYTAIAAEDDEANLEAVVVTAEDEIDDLVTALEGDPQAQEIADELADAVKNGAAEEDINALLVELADYINDKGYDVADIKNGKAKEIMGAFLEDCGVDSEALGAAISETNEVLDDVFGNEEATGTDTESYDDFNDVSVDTDSGSESYAVYGVESTTIPDTGYIG